MKAVLLLNERQLIAADRFVELRIWRVATPVKGSTHLFRYALAFIVNGKCVMRYDNEPGKGDHRHMGESEERYDFARAERLLDDFWKDVDQWQSRTS